MGKFHVFLLRNRENLQSKSKQNKVFEVREKLFYDSRRNKIRCSVSGKLVYDSPRNKIRFSVSGKTDLRFPQKINFHRYLVSSISHFASIAVPAERQGASKAFTPLTFSVSFHSLSAFRFFSTEIEFKK